MPLGGEVICKERRMVDEEKLSGILEEMPFPLTEGQLTFIKGFISGTGNAFLLGDQGVGKSACMLVLKKYYEEEILFCGTSGISSAELPEGIGSGTSHKILSLKTELSDDKNMKRVNPQTQAIFGKTDLIKIVVIDEAFCWDSELLYQCQLRKKRYDKATRNRARRNIRFLLVGDNLQRLPIADEERREELTNRHGHWLMFRSNLWKTMQFTGYMLTENKRQDNSSRDDKIFGEALKVLRYRDVERLPKLIAWLNKRVDKNYSREGMYLAPTNRLVDDHNVEYLKQFSNNTNMVYNVTISGKFDMRDSPIDDTVVLAEGCDIYTVVNHPDGDYQNGTTLTVDMVSSDGVWATPFGGGESIFIAVVEFENTETYIETTTDKVTGEQTHVQKRRVAGTAHQLPCRVAAGMTYAKCQGKTFLKDGVLDVGTDWLWDTLPDFMVAGIFVGLSRFKSINQITLARPLKEKHIRVCQDSVNFWFETLEKQTLNTL